MESSITIFNKELEYDFLSGWIKYTRLSKGFSQEALAHGICSTSHLCYFEKGEKKLRGDIIEALLLKLDINTINDIKDIGLVRQKLRNMSFEIECLNYEAAEDIWKCLTHLQQIFEISPYNIEYKVYELLYMVFVVNKNENVESLKNTIATMDKIFSSFQDDIKYIFLLASGKFFFKYISHDEGIRRFTEASKLKDTCWINFNLGFSYCFNNEPLKGTYYLETALKSYEMNGQYLNALWCHNHLGICYASLNIFHKAEKHFMATLTGAKHFDIKDIFFHVYVNISDLYLVQNKFQDSCKWSISAMLLKDCDPILPASNYVEAAFALGKPECCEQIFKDYLIDEYKNSKYFKLLYFNYLYMFHKNEDIFYKTTTEDIIPYYESIGYMNIIRTIKFKLIEYLEKNRKYKEANMIYKKLLILP